MQYLFLMCSERSGSNLIRSMFDAHPRVCGPSPVHLVRLLCDHALRWGPLTDDAHWEALLTDVVALLDTKVGTWATSWTARALREAVPDRSLASVLRTVFEAEAAAHGKDTLFLKENHLWRHLPFLALAFPALRVVYQVRDARDMALSWKNNNELRGDVVRASGVWRDDQRAGLRLLGQLRSLQRIGVVRYEDLVDDPEIELSRLCAAIGLPFDDAMLTAHRAAGARRDAAASASWANLAKPVMRGNHGKWRDGLDTDEVRFVEWRCGPEMKALGYAAEHRALDEAEGEALLAELSTRERWEKEGYAGVPQSEKEARAARAAVERRIRERPVWAAAR